MRTKLKLRPSRENWILENEARYIYIIQEYNNFLYTRYENLQAILYIIIIKFTILLTFGCQKWKKKRFSPGTIKKNIDNISTPQKHAYFDISIVFEATKKYYYDYCTPVSGRFYKKNDQHQLSVRLLNRFPVDSCRGWLWPQQREVHPSPISVVAFQKPLNKPLTLRRTKGPTALCVGSLSLSLRLFDTRPIHFSPIILYMCRIFSRFSKKTQLLLLILIAGGGCLQRTVCIITSSRDFQKVPIFLED